MADYLAQHQRGRSFDIGGSKYAYVREAHRSYEAASKSLKNSPRESKIRKESNFNDFGILTKSMDGTVSNEKISKMIDEKSSSIQNHSTSQDRTPKIALNVNFSKNLSRLASTGDQMGYRGTYVRASSIESRDSRQQAADKLLKLKKEAQGSKHNVMAELHKSVQHMDIIEHDAELEQDLSSSMVMDDPSPADPRISQLLAQIPTQRLLDSERLADEIAAVLQVKSDPVHEAARLLVEQAKRTAFLSEVLAKKNNLENVYLAEINKLQAEVARLSQASTAHRSAEKPKSASKTKLRTLRHAMANERLTQPFK